MKQSANVVCRQRIPFHIITFHGDDYVQRADPHPAPEPRNLQEPVESGGQLIVSEELLEAPVPMPAQSTPPLPFKAQIPLEMILTNLAVDLAVARLFSLAYSSARYILRPGWRSIQSIRQKTCNKG